jgi:hypothetical protein
VAIGRLFSADGILLLKTAVLLVLVRLAVLLCPFRTLVGLAERVTSVPCMRRPDPETDSIARARWALSKASRYLPGTKHCLTQALVAKTLLAWSAEASDLRIGVAKGDDGCLIAHAWLERGGAPILGLTASEAQQYAAMPELLSRVRR